LLAWLVAACASPPLRFDQPIVLLGEVHDNAAQHALRLQALKAWLAQGVRPALVMEQFDRRRQGDIDRLRAQTPPPDADALIAAVGGPGWDWAFYRPYVALALQYGLPLVAANVSRDEARQVIREGLQAHGFDPTVPEDLLALQARDIEDTHCGLLEEGSSDSGQYDRVLRTAVQPRPDPCAAMRGVRDGPAAR
jgi:uncharacterized iron-regulated protein